VKGDKMYFDLEIVFFLSFNFSLCVHYAFEFVNKKHKQKFKTIEFTFIKIRKYGKIKNDSG